MKRSWWTDLWWVFLLLQPWSRWANRPEASWALNLCLSSIQPAWSFTFGSLCQFWFCRTGSGLDRRSAESALLSAAVFRNQFKIKHPVKFNFICFIWGEWNQNSWSGPENKLKLRTTKELNVMGNRRVTLDQNTNFSWMDSPLTSEEMKWFRLLWVSSV